MLLSGPPVLRQWQRLLLLEEAACERDVAGYSLFNVQLATAVFPSLQTRRQVPEQGCVLMLTDFPPCLCEQPAKVS
jgi:hypothetical protein